MFDARLRRTPFLVLLCAILSSASAAAQDGVAVRTTIFRGAEIPYEIIDEWAVYAGDIILGTAEEAAARAPRAPRGFWGRSDGQAPGSVSAGGPLAERRRAVRGRRRRSAP